MKTFTLIDTKIGKLFLFAEQNKLTGLYTQNQKSLALTPDYIFAPEHKIFKEIEIQLNEYFLGKRKKFDIDFHFFNGTEFQQKVWRAILPINCGETASYSDIAKSLDLKKSVRAVASAIGKNPIFIIVPCHRVIGKNGSLTGYAGGLELKKKLLLVEGIIF